MTLSSDLIHDLHAAGLDLRLDPVTRTIYSTDASIYQIEPLGVIFPRSADDLAAAVSLAARYATPVLARGAGSSLAGQAIGAALILDCSRYLNRILEIDPAAQTALVEPGVVLNALNRAAAKHGLQFGPDPASAERATVGGSIANNASGAHSILYGLCADHLLGADVVLADGSLAWLDARSAPPAEGASRLAQFYAAALRIRQDYAAVIRARWPRTWRNAAGYNLNYLLPWAASSPPGWQPAINPASPHSALSAGESVLPDGAPPALNLAALLAGSEGTLAVIRRARLRLVAKPRHTILAVLAYASVAQACDAVPSLLLHNPSAVELIPQSLIRLARSVPAAAHNLTWLQALPAGDDPAALLVLEFAGDDPAALKNRARVLGSEVLLAETAAAQKQVWEVRKMGLGILQSRPGEPRLVTFIEDMAVPVDRLGEFVREMERIMAAQGTYGDFYAHASAGCLHMRPVLNIKTAHGLAAMRSIAAQAAELVARLGGTMSGEHGDGIARSEWLERVYGPEITAAFRQLKQAADPANLLNPGKIVSAPPMDQSLRPQPLPASLGWQPVMDFTRSGGAPGAAGLLGALEMCNGAAVCRKAEGVMCPSFQVTQDETYSTRGRANLFRAMLLTNQVSSDTAPNNPLAAQGDALRATYQTLDLCLACKGCKADCPSAVDMAKLKYEFMNAYYHQHPRKLRDYLFGYIGVVAPLGAVFAPLANWILRSPPLRRLAERFFGLACQRPFPAFRRLSRAQAGPAQASPLPSPAQPVLFLGDTFNRYFYPQTEQAARQILGQAHPIINIPILGAGRTLISKGFLGPAKQHAARLVEAIARLDPQGALPVVGLEPSEIYTLRDEYLDFFPDDPRVEALAGRAWMIDEYLIRDQTGPRLSASQQTRATVWLHGHCYQKAQPPAADGKPVGVAATVALLESAGYAVKVIDDGCCGMAGAFGYEVEHYDFSLKVSELALLPALRAARQANPDILIAAAGVSCQAQIEDGMLNHATNVTPFHPIVLAARGWAAEKTV